MNEGSEHGTNPELLELLQGHAVKITKLMSVHWDSVVNQTEQWPRLRGRRATQMTADLTGLFTEYVEKTLHWLNYFVLDPSWLNMTAVNYAANAAREAASEVRQARTRFEQEFELERDDLSTEPREHAPLAVTEKIGPPPEADDDASDVA